MKKAWKWRFERSLRMFGPEGLKRLNDSHVTIFGLGGVGSYAAEALARTAVGKLTLVDFDRICITNSNRQLPATVENIGRFKADAVADRLRTINPDIELEVIREFYDKDTSDRLLNPPPDLVLDCIDNITAKMHLLATCVERKIAAVTALGASARLDPTKIQIAPLVDTHSDPLGKALRKFIRRKHHVTNEQLAEVTAVFSDEPIRKPFDGEDGIACGVDCVCPNPDNDHHTCDQRNVIYGTAVFVTAAFGLAAASVAVQQLLADGEEERSPEA